MRGKLPFMTGRVGLFKCARRRFRLSGSLPNTPDILPPYNIYNFHLHNT